MAIFRLPGLLGQGIVTSEFVTLVRSWEPSNFHHLRHVSAIPYGGVSQSRKCRYTCFPTSQAGAFRKCWTSLQPRRRWVVLILERLGLKSAGSSGRADADQGNR